MKREFGMTIGYGGKIQLWMYYYKATKEEPAQMQFDVSNPDQRKTVVSNINLEQAKQIRDRLNDFIQECEKRSRLRFGSWYWNWK